MEKNHVIIGNAGRGRQTTWPSAENPGLYTKQEAEKIIDGFKSKQTIFNGGPNGHIAWHTKSLDKALDYVSSGNTCYKPLKELQDKHLKESIMTEPLINRLEKFAGTKLKAGRNIIKGFPMDIEDNPDGTYIDMTAVDKDACTSLVKLLRAAKFKAKRDGDKGISITEGIEELNLIQELMGLDKEPVQVTEAKVKSDMAELVDRFIEQEKLWHFEGGRGVNNFEKIIKAIGYRNMDYFLEDNPGCLEKMVEWLRDTDNIEEWKEKLAAELPVEDDEEQQ